MALRIYDTLTREKRDFVPLEAGKVRMYVCGMTVQDKPHVGHMRSAIVNDTIRRYLTQLGYEVTYVKNFTDVDDKIIEKARDENVDYQVVAERNIEAYFRAADAFGVQRATIYPKATEHIREIVECIRKLEAKGFAYAAGGDVYYEVRKKADYGKLSGRKVEDLRSGFRIEVDEKKRDALDFALWKGAKEGEVSWETPWGPGRPGWHIECSAMSMKYLGETFDIHGGGQDLIFPHHENEIAQSEAANGKPFVNYWVHHGMLNMGGQKMSKSEKRFFLVDDILAEYSPEEVRWYLLSTHYRSPIEFSRERLDEARIALERIRLPMERFGGFEEPGAGEGGAAGASGEMREAVAEAEARFREAMDDDFNTAKAVGHLFDLGRTTNRIGDAGDLDSARAGARTLVRLGRILGVFAGPRETAEDWPPEVLALVADREAARRARDWKRADALRDQLLALGVGVEDGPNGPTIRRRA